MNRIAGAVAAAAVFTGVVGVAKAEQWVDYTPEKGVWSKTYMHVEPSRIDDYLVALKKTWVPSEEMAKKRGLIDNYLVQVNANASTAGANVVLMEHFVSWSALQPDKVRDLAMEKEYQAMFPKAQNDAEQAARAKYRNQVTQEMWSAVDFNTK